MERQQDLSQKYPKRRSLSPNKSQSMKTIALSSWLMNYCTRHGIPWLFICNLHLIFIIFERVIICMDHRQHIPIREIFGKIFISSKYNRSDRKISELKRPSSKMECLLFSSFFWIRTRAQQDRLLLAHLTMRIIEMPNEITHFIDYFSVYFSTKKNEFICDKQ